MYKKTTETDEPPSFFIPRRHMAWRSGGAVSGTGGPMILIVCIDDRGGMLFHHRRQSQDRVLREDLLREVRGAKLLMNAYSAKLFEADAPVTVAEDCLARAGTGDYCFVENLDPLPYAAKLEQIIVYRWNRVYPADFYFDLPLETPEWTRTRTEEFAGSSHERITKDVYTL